MKMHIEFHSIREFAAFISIIRGEVPDADKIEALTKLLGTSADALEQAVETVVPTP